MPYLDLLMDKEPQEEADPQEVINRIQGGINKLSGGEK